LEHRPIAGHLRPVSELLTLSGHHWSGIYELHAPWFNKRCLESKLIPAVFMGILTFVCKQCRDLATTRPLAEMGEAQPFVKGAVILNRQRSIRLTDQRVVLLLYFTSIAP
jgi:hypothetical protein